MPSHCADFIATNSSPGVLLIRRKVSVGRIIEELILIWETSEAEEWTDTLEYIPL